MPASFRFSLTPYLVPEVKANRYRGVDALQRMSAEVLVTKGPLPLPVSRCQRTYQLRGVVRIGSSTPASRETK